MKTKATLYWKPTFAVIVWGFSFIATKNALDEIKPEVIVFIRQLLGILFLTLIAIQRKDSFRINKNDLGWILILAAVACFHLWIQVTGLQWTSASNTGWIIGITPVFMALLSMIFFKEKILYQQAWGIIIAFFGLFLLVSKGSFASLDFIKNKGDILILGSSFTWSVYSLVSKKITLRYSPTMTTLYLFIFVAVFIAPFTINSSNLIAVGHLSFSGWMSVLFLGILCSGAAYTLWAQSLSEMSASKVGAFLYIEPFITFFGAWLLLGEHINVLMLVSGLIIIGGVILVNRK